VKERDKGMDDRATNLKKWEMNAGEEREGDEREKGIEEVADGNKLYSSSSLKAYALPTSIYCHDLYVCDYRRGMDW
jgi:hypothetical protein